MQVDLKEEEFLKKEIKQELQGIARGIARKTMAEELEKELNRLIDNKLEEAKKTDYYNSVASHVAEIVAQKMSRNINIDTKEIDELVQKRVEEYIDKLMHHYGGIQDFIQAYINKSIAETLRNK